MMLRDAAIAATASARELDARAVPSNGDHLVDGQRADADGHGVHCLGQCTCIVTLMASWNTGDPIADRSRRDTLSGIPDRSDDRA